MTVLSRLQLCFPLSLSLSLQYSDHALRPCVRHCLAAARATHKTTESILLFGGADRCSERVCADGDVLRGLGERHAEREGETGDPKSDGWNEAVGNKGSNKTLQWYNSLKHKSCAEENVPLLVSAQGMLGLSSTAKQKLSLSVFFFFAVAIG